jgi:multidrug efflux pump subunit AcrA (membrane-fusion protein)
LSPISSGRAQPFRHGDECTADAISDQRTGNTYFSATVEVTADELAKVRQVKLYPGMPVEAAIITGKRTMLTFLLEPFTDSFAHAFREE